MFIAVSLRQHFQQPRRQFGNFGHGSYMMAIGGPVNGGKIYGKWTGLDRNKLYQGRDVPVHTDFRDIFAETLLALFGFHTDTHDFFPKYEANARSLGLLKSVV